MKQLEKIKFIETHTTDLICEHLSCIRYFTRPELDGRGPCHLRAYDFMGLQRTKEAVRMQYIKCVKKM